MSTQTGQQAESIAAEYLAQHQMRVVVRNWRNRWCEIDLIAVDDSGAVHFVEVKYRRYDNYGSGLEYITPNKAGRLRRAAMVWMASEAPSRAFQIDVISISGRLDNPQLEYLPNAITG